MTAAVGFWLYRSRLLRRPAPMTVQVFCPAAAAVGGAHLSGALRGGPQLSTLQATAAAMGACHPAQGLRECGCAAPLRSGGWGFLAAAGGCGIGFWIARRLARGCGGRRRLWDRGGGRWVAEASRCGRVLLDAWLGLGLSPANLDPWRTSSRPRLMPSSRPPGWRFMPRFSAVKFRKVASPQAF